MREIYLRGFEIAVKEAKSAWIAENGIYDVKIGNSSLNILQKANFELVDDLIVEKTAMQFDNKPIFLDLKK